MQGRKTQQWAEVRSRVLGCAGPNGWVLYLHPLDQGNCLLALPASRGAHAFGSTR